MIILPPDQSIGLVGVGKKLVGVLHALSTKAIDVLSLASHHYFSVFSTADGIVIDESQDTGDDRPVRLGRCYNFNGAGDHLIFPHLTGSETVSSGGTAVPTISAGRIDFTAGTAWEILLSDGTLLHCEEEAGTTSYNADGSGKHGTISTSDLTALHSTDVDVEASSANDVGYSAGAGGVIIPRNEAIPTEDALGNPLQYTGRVKYNLKVVGSGAMHIGGVTGTYVDVGDVLDNDGSESCSWVFRFKTSSSQTNERFLARGDSSNTPNGWAIGHSNGAFRFIMRANNSTSNNLNLTGADSSWNDGDPHVAIVTYDGSKSAAGVMVMADGSVQSMAGADNLTGNPSVTDSAVIGFKHGGGKALTGDVWDVEFYDTVLTPSEIAYINSDGATGTKPAPIAHYAAIEKSGTRVFNKVAGGAHGKVVTSDLADFWSSTQDVYHDALVNGFSVGTNYLVNSDIRLAPNDSAGSSSVTDIVHDGRNLKAWSQGPASEIVRIYPNTSNAFFTPVDSNFTHLKWYEHIVVGVPYYKAQFKIVVGGVTRWLSVDATSWITGSTQETNFSALAQTHTDGYKYIALPPLPGVVTSMSLVSFYRYGSDFEVYLGEFHLTHDIDHVYIETEGGSAVGSYIPALADGSGTDALGNSLQYPAGNWNYPPCFLSADPAPAMVVKFDQGSGPEPNRLLFDAASNAIHFNPADISNGNYVNWLFCNRANAGYIKDIIFTTEPLAGQELSDMLTFVEAN